MEKTASGDCTSWRDILIFKYTSADTGPKPWKTSPRHQGLPEQKWLWSQSLQQSPQLRIQHLILFLSPPRPIFLESYPIKLIHTFNAGTIHQPEMYRPRAQPQAPTACLSTRTWIRTVLCFLQHRYPLPVHDRRRVDSSPSSWFQPSRLDQRFLPTPRVLLLKTQWRKTETKW